MFSTGSLLHSRFDDIKNGSVETYTIVYSTSKLHYRCLDFHILRGLGTGTFLFPVFLRSQNLAVLMYDRRGTSAQKQRNIE